MTEDPINQSHRKTVKPLIRIGVNCVVKYLTNYYHQILQLKKKIKSNTVTLSVFKRTGKVAMKKTERNILVHVKSQLL